MTATRATAPADLTAETSTEASTGSIRPPFHGWRIVAYASVAVVTPLPAAGPAARAAAPAALPAEPCAGG